jgi:hypothetical protein
MKYVVALAQLIITCQNTSVALKTSKPMAAMNRMQMQMLERLSALGYKF